MQHKWINFANVSDSTSSTRAHEHTATPAHEYIPHEHTSTRVSCLVFVFGWVLCFLFWLRRMLVIAVSQPLKLAFIQLCLSKSKRASNLFPHCVDIVMECLNNENSLKIVLAGLIFGKQIIKASFANDAFANEMTRLTQQLLILIGKPESNAFRPEFSLVRYADEYHFDGVQLHPTKVKNRKSDATSAQVLIFESLADLLRFEFNLDLLNNDLSILELIFTRLDQSNERELQEAIMDCLSKIQKAFQTRPSKLVVRKQLKRCLEYQVTISRSLECEWMALRWLNNVFSFNNSDIRLINLSRIDHEDKNIRECAIKSFTQETYDNLYNREKMIEFDENKDNFKDELYPIFEDFVDHAHKSVLVCFIFRICLLKAWIMLVFGHFMHSNCGRAT